MILQCPTWNQCPSSRRERAFHRLSMVSPQVAAQRNIKREIQQHTYLVECPPLRSIQHLEHNSILLPCHHRFVAHHFLRQGLKTQGKLHQMRQVIHAGRQRWTRAFRACRCPRMTANPAASFHTNYQGPLNLNYMHTMARIHTEGSWEDPTT